MKITTIYIDIYIYIYMHVYMSARKSCVIVTCANKSSLERHHVYRILLSFVRKNTWNNICVCMYYLCVT